jgi:Zn ribbon nucleic-acid-binding protein
MKTIVSVNEISEFEIKPKNEIEKWKKIVSEEIAKIWSSKKDWVEISCPVCDKNEFISAFEKNGFQYVECNHCKTLYAKSRPNQIELKKWFTKSESVKYWEAELLAKSAGSRDAKIVEPRSQWIFDSLAEDIISSIEQKVNYLDISFFGKMLNQKIADKSNNFNIISAGNFTLKKPKDSKLSYTTLFATSNTSFFFLRINFATSLSNSVTPSETSTTNKSTVASSIAISTCFLISDSKISSLPKI